MTKPVEYDESIQNNIVSRISAYAGKTMSQVCNPGMTAREAIALADYYESLLQRLESAKHRENDALDLAGNHVLTIKDLRQQLEAAQRELAKYVERSERDKTIDELFDGSTAALWSSYCDFKMENENLRDKLAQCEANARRYLWLAEQEIGSPVFAASGKNGAWGECGHSSFGGYKDILDGYIDKAIAAEGAGEEGK